MQKKLSKYETPWGNPALVIKRKRGKPKVTKYHTGPLPLRKAGLTRYVFWADQQFPHTIPIGGMLKFLKKFKPDYLILGGDVFNGDPFDHWAKVKPGKAKEMPDSKEHYERFQAEFMDPVQRALGCGSLVYIKGNHEAWADRAIEMDSQGKGYWEIENNVIGVDFWVEQFKSASLGKNNFIHGDQPGISGQNVAKKAMGIYHDNITLGHIHRFESFVEISPIEQKDKHMAQVVGCWCPLNPHYALNKPNAWINGFAYGYVKPDGNFWQYPVYATPQGSFIVEGEEFAP